MAEVFKVIKGELDPDLTLKAGWTAFAGCLREAGSGEDQIDAMRSAYFMGAAQSFMSIDQAAKIGMVELSAVMNQMFKDVDEEMTRNASALLQDTQGSA
jgi:hypothetical protein